MVQLADGGESTVFLSDFVRQFSDASVYCILAMTQPQISLFRKVSIV